MKGIARIALTATAISLASLVAGCESFDPTTLFDAEIFNTKKKLPGERKPVFPEGTPGVSQGVPAELVKGYQPPAEPEPQQAAVEPKPEPKPKPKPKPKVAAKPKEPPAPAPAPAPTQQAPAQAQVQWPAPPPTTQQQQPQSTAGGGWPSAPQPGGGVAWPDPPPTNR
jgi:outer membrane biosynthesis protein TonB